MVTGGFIADRRVKPMDALQVTGLNATSVAGWERRVVNNYSHPAWMWSNVSVAMLAATPAAMSLTPRIQKDFLAYNMAYGQTMLSVFGQTMLIKSLVQKPRPYMYNPLVAINEKTMKDGRFSFPSMHTAFSAAACYFGAYTFSLYYPESELKPYVWIGAALLPMVTGYLRVKAGEHFVTDVATGYLIGAANGIIIPMIFRLRGKDRN